MEIRAGPEGLFFMGLIVLAEKAGERSRRCDNGIGIIN